MTASAVLDAIIRARKELSSLQLVTVAPWRETLLAMV
jgi:hypothetical protein